MCAVTVCGEIMRIVPISANGMPLARSSRISRSRVEMSGASFVAATSGSEFFFICMARRTWRVTAGDIGDPPPLMRRTQLSRLSWELRST